VVGIDDVVSELELDDLDLSGRLELLDERCLFDYLGWNDVLLRCAGNGTDLGIPGWGPVFVLVFLFTSASSCLRG
jgi:hypothetical protein